MNRTAHKRPSRRRSGRSAPQWSTRYAVEALESRLLLDAISSGTLHGAFERGPPIILTIPAGGSLVEPAFINGQFFGITRITVELDLTFANDSNLSAMVTSPMGTSVQLFQNPAAEQNFTHAVFEDDAAAAIGQVAVPSFTGTFQPQSPFSTFAGEDPNGRWVLTISNNSPTLTGTLTDWSVTAFDQDPATGRYVVPFVQVSPNTTNGSDFGATNSSVTQQFTVINTASGLLVEGSSTPIVNLAPQYPVDSVYGINNVRSVLDVNSLIPSLSAVTATVTIDDINDSNLTLVLTSPQGTSVTLASGLPEFQSSPLGIPTVTNADQFQGATFSDAASTSIAAAAPVQMPLNGTYLPQSPLSAFGGQNPNGTWTLLVEGGTSNLPASQVNWSLAIQGTPQAAPATIAGPNASEFTILRQPEFPVAIGSSTTFDVAFNPIAAGEASAAIVLTNLDGPGFTHNFSIQGLGIAQGKISVLGSTYFGALDYTNHQTIQKTYTITNSGLSPLQLSAPYIVAEPAAATVSADHGQLFPEPGAASAFIISGAPLLGSLLPGQSTQFVVSFIAQSTPGSYFYDPQYAFEPFLPAPNCDSENPQFLATIVVPSNDPDNPTITLNVECDVNDKIGLGNANQTPADSAIAVVGSDYFSQNGGTSAAETYTVINTGSSPLQLGLPFFNAEPADAVATGAGGILIPEPGAASAFAVTSGPLLTSLSPGQSTQFVVSFVGISNAGLYFYDPQKSTTPIPFLPTPGCFAEDPRFLATLVIPSNDPNNSAITLNIAGDSPAHEAGRYGGSKIPLGNGNTPTNQNPALPFTVSQNGSELSDQQTIHLGVITAGGAAVQVPLEFDNNGGDTLNFAMTNNASGLTLSGPSALVSPFAIADVSILPSVNILQSISGSVLLTVTDKNSGVAQGFTLYVDGQIVTPPTNFTNNIDTLFTTGQSSTFPITTTSFPAATLSVTGGSLPAGVSFIDNGNGTGKLAGTPAAGTSGLYSLTLSANNSAAPAAAQTFTLAVTSGTALVWTGNADGVTWSNPGNWSGGAVPGQNSAAFIPPGLGTVQISTAFTLHALMAASPIQIDAGATLVLLTPSALDSSLTIKSGGKIDLTTASLALDYGSGNPSPLAAVKSYLSSGAIFSSTAKSNPQDALGYADGSTDSGTSAQPGQVLLKYTQNGDTNLDALVNFADLVAVIQNFNKAGTDWSLGNFTGSASTSFNDLVAVVQNFNKTLSPPAASSAAQTGGGSTLLATGTSIPLAQSATAQPQTKVSPADYSAPAVSVSPPAGNLEDDILQSNSAADAAALINA